MPRCKFLLAGHCRSEHLFPTIAYQTRITRNIPELEGNVESIMCKIPELPSKTLEIQFQECNISLFCPVVGIDGIDECDDEDIQEAFLNIIGNTVKSGECPFRFLISSRPEPHLRKLFTQMLHTYLTRAVQRTVTTRMSMTTYKQMEGYTRNVTSWLSILR